MSRECADLLLDMLAELEPRRAEHMTLPNAYPIVYAEVWSARPDARTLIVYCLYDMMPVVCENWVTPPFAAEVVDAGIAGLPREYGQCLIGRGREQSEGPTHVRG